MEDGRNEATVRRDGGQFAFDGMLTGLVQLNGKGQPFHAAMGLKPFHPKGFNLRKRLRRRKIHGDVRRVIMADFRTKYATWRCKLREINAESFACPNGMRHLQ